MTQIFECYHFVGNLFDYIDQAPHNKSLAEAFYRKSREQFTNPFIKSLPADGQYNLGMMYKFGLGVKKDSDLANHYFNKACIKTFNDTCPDLSDPYISKNFWSMQNLTLQNLMAAALKGSPDALYGLAWNFHASRLRQRDSKEAFKWAEKLASLKDQRGEYILAKYYQMGIGTDRDVKKALDYYDDLTQLGAVDVYDDIADIYMQGDGVPKDEVKALENYKRFYQEVKTINLSPEKYPYASVAYLYKKGYGLDKDVQHAIQIYNDGIQHDDPDSYLGLARLYMDGDGVKQDYARAKGLLKRGYEISRAERFDFGGTSTYLGILYLEGKGVEKNYDKARELIEDDAELMYPEALYRLGYMYQEGLGVGKNPQKAKEYFTQTCERTNEKACQVLKGNG